MTAIRIVESSGSLGSLQVSDGLGGFLPGSVTAGSNVTINGNGSGSFSISSFYPEPSGSLGSLQVSDGLGGFISGSITAGTNVTINDNGSGSFSISSFYPEPSGPLGSIQVSDGLGGFISGSILGGNNIDVTSDGSGTFTISQRDTRTNNSPTVSGIIGLSRDRGSTIVTGSSIPSQQPVTITGIDFSVGSFDPSNIDVFVNGQLLYSGTSTEVASTSADYSIYDKNSLLFAFDLLKDDIVTTTVITSGTNSGTAPSDSSYIVYEPSPELSEARVLEPGPGLSIDTSEPGKFKITSTRSKKSHMVTASHSLGKPLTLPSVDFTAGSFNNDRIDVYVNGQLMLSGANADYILDGTGSGIIFNFDLLDGDQVGTIIM